MSRLLRRPLLTLGLLTTLTGLRTPRPRVSRVLVLLLPLLLLGRPLGVRPLLPVGTSDPGMQVDTEGDDPKDPSKASGAEQPRLDGQKTRVSFSSPMPRSQSRLLEQHWDIPPAMYTHTRGYIARISLQQCKHCVKCSSGPLWFLAVAPIMKESFLRFVSMARRVLANSTCPQPSIRVTRNRESPNDCKEFLSSRNSHGEAAAH